MDIQNPDLSHTAFLEESLGDIESSELLLTAKKYPQAVYAFQQSVEKSCKYIGLTIRAITYEKLKNAGHNPHKVFRLMFNEPIMAQYAGNTQFDVLENSFRPLKIDERSNNIFQYLNQSLSDKQIVIKNKQSPSEAIIAYYRNNPFSEKLGLDIEEEIHKSRHVLPIIDKMSLELIDDINRVSVGISCQIILSFLVWGIEENSRYPDYEKDITPSSIYTEETTIVQNLPFFINIQKMCIHSVYTYFNKK